MCINQPVGIQVYLSLFYYENKGHMRNGGYYLTIRRRRRLKLYNFIQKWTIDDLCSLAKTKKSFKQEAFAGRTNNGLCFHSFKTLSMSCMHLDTLFIDSNKEFTTFVHVFTYSSIWSMDEFHLKADFERVDLHSIPGKSEFDTLSLSRRKSVDSTIGFRVIVSLYFRHTTSSFRILARNNRRLWYVFLAVADDGNLTW